MVLFYRLYLVASVTEIRPAVYPFPICTSTRCVASAPKLLRDSKINLEQGGNQGRRYSRILDIGVQHTLDGDCGWTHQSVSSGLSSAMSPVVLAGFVAPPPVPKIETTEPAGAGFAAEL